jgi:DNA-binding LytR/AlgR family response regulator
MRTLKVVIADDEPLARERLGRLLREAGCEVMAELEDGPSLLDWFSTGREADALFTDIQMPGANGLEVLAELRNAPPVVFVTAYSDYAVRAFELAAVDYLLKPVYEDRLAKSLERLRNNQVSRLSQGEIRNLLPSNHRFLVRAGLGRLFLELKHVSHFEVEDEVAWAWAGGKRFRTQWTSLKEVEQAFPDGNLLRISRQALLRPDAVLGFRPISAGRIMVRVADGKELEVSRAMTPRLKEQMGVG